MKRSCLAGSLATGPIARGLLAALLVAGTTLSAQESPSPPGGDDTEQLLAQAQAELAAGRAAEAEDLLREALRRERRPALLLELAAVLIERASALEGTSDLGQSLRQGVLEEAISIYREIASQKGGAVAAGGAVVAAGGAVVDGALGAATCQTLLGRDDAAEATLRDALETLRAGGADRSERRRLVSARVRFLGLRGRKADAESEIASAKEAGELDAAGEQLERLRIAATLKEEGQALPLSLAALAAGNDSFDVAFLSWDAFGDQSLEPMLHLYSRLLEVRPDDAALRYYRGVVRWRMGDGAGAATDLKACVGDPRIGARARLHLGRALVRAKRAEEALPEFERLLADGGALVPDALLGLVDVAVARAQARRFAEALELYERVLAKEPTNFYAQIGRPLCHKSMGDIDGAAKAYEAGLAALPEDPQLLNDYALLLRMRGDAQAKEIFERALGNGSPDAGENLGIIAYRDDRDLEAAARYFARTLLLKPDRPRIRFYRELCLCDLANGAAPQGERR